MKSTNFERPIDKCSECGRILVGVEVSRCLSCSGNYTRPTTGSNRVHPSEIQRKRLMRVWGRPMECLVCGAGKDRTSSFSFHHVRREDKLFTISQFNGSDDRILRAEMDKCVLLCSQCHGSVHGMDGVNLYPCDDKCWHYRMLNKS